MKEKGFLVFNLNELEVDEVLTESVFTMSSYSTNHRSHFTFSRSRGRGSDSAVGFHLQEAIEGRLHNPDHNSAISMDFMLIILLRSAPILNPRNSNNLRKKTLLPSSGLKLKFPLFPNNDLQSPHRFSVYNLRRLVLITFKESRQGVVLQTQ